MPPGWLPQAKPAATSIAAALPAGAVPLVHCNVRFWPDPGRLADWSIGLRMLENSPSLAKRNEDPQLPRTVAPINWSTTQVNANFGLVVSPVRLILPP